MLEFNNMFEIVSGNGSHKPNRKLCQQLQLVKIFSKYE